MKTQNPQGGFTAVYAKQARHPSAVEKAWAAAFAAIRETVPAATDDEVRAYLDSEYGARTAAEVLRGVPVAEQLSYRAARFRRHFHALQRSLKHEQESE